MLKCDVCVCVLCDVDVVLLVDVLSLGCACCRSCIVLCCVCARFVQNNAMCTFKTLSCVPSKRTCHIRHERFDGTHGSVSRVHTGGRLGQTVALSVSLSSHTSLSLALLVTLCSSLFLSLSARLSFFLFSVSCRLSLFLFLSSMTMTTDGTRLWLALRARVHAPWPTPCWAHMFASCTKQLSR